MKDFGRTSARGSWILWTWGALLALLLSAAGPALAQGGGSPPAIGGQAPDLSLTLGNDSPVKLSKLTAEGPVVLVMLRGYPGYQCPLCSKQVGELLKSAPQFAAAKARVVLIYPGPAQGLPQRGREFLQGQDLPANFSLVLDPDYALTNALHLRWDAPRETAYPSAFVLGRDRRVQFARVSRSHGGRATAEELLQALTK